MTHGLGCVAATGPCTGKRRGRFGGLSNSALSLTWLCVVGYAPGYVNATPVVPVGQPLYFEINKGQAAADVGFLSRGAEYTLYLTPTSAVIALDTKRLGNASDQHRAAVRITPVGTDGGGSPVNLQGVDALPGRSNYFITNQRARWLTDVAHYRAVVYPQLYPGIDMLFRSDSGRIEFDFRLQPGARPERVRLKITGSKQLKVDAAGNLTLNANGHLLTLKAPRAFQSINGARREIATRFMLMGRQTVGFRVAAYDHRQALVIDPVLSFSSYAGGSANDIAHGVAFDAQGNIYVVGETSSTDFPVHNAYQSSSPVSPSAFIMKLDAKTHDVVYATYLGSNVTEARGIAVDSTGSAYVVGDTSSTAFPLMNAYQPSMHGLIDIYVTKLTPAGNALAYSTYLGGDSVDRGRALALDAQGDIYITGVTGSTNFPLVNPLQTTLRGSTDAYVAKLSPARGTLDYSTYIGGDGLDYGTAIVVDSSLRAFVGGYTNSGNFPTLNPLQAVKGGANDAFVARFSPAGDLAYATYLGGAGADYANAIGIDTAGNILLAGQTYSANFPVSHALQAALAGTTDAFVSKLNAGGTALVYSTYLGGNQGEVAYGLRVDAAGNAYVAGQTDSLDFPTAYPVQAANAGGTDAFITQLSAAGASLGYSTYLGGAASDYARALAVDSGGNVAIAGITESDNLPRVDANQSVRGGNQDGFVALLLADTDHDDVPDGADNCPSAANPSQADLDRDGLGDACDTDIDGDGLSNAAESGLGTDPRSYDTDGDGLSDGQEVLVYNTNPKHSDTGDLVPRGAPDGKVNIADLLMLTRYVEGLQTPDALASTLGDLNKDGRLDLRDVLLLRRMLGVM